MAPWKKRASVLLAAATLWAARVPTASAAPATQPARRPNVLVIIADDLGYADLGAQKLEPDIKTPNIDSIAAQGVRFTSGYVSCPVCSPSRAGLLTGRYQERFGHEFNPGPNPPGNFGLPVDQVTLADDLKAAGYRTGMVGKWHEGTALDRQPMSRGFESSYGFLGGAHTYVKLGEPTGKDPILRNGKPVGESEYLTDAISREAVGFIDQHKAEPFFLYVAYNAVHVPQEAPQKYQDRFSEVKDVHRKLMLAMLSAEDDGVGRMLAALKNANLEENTLIFFISDNGGPTALNGSSNRPLSGFKAQVWEGGIRVPFAVQWKGHIAAGQVVDQPVISLDILPTALAATGAPLSKPRPIDGVNLLPLLLHENNRAPHESLFWRYGGQRAMRQGDYKLVQIGQESPQLFDLKADVGEKHDLAAEQPQRAEQMFAAYEKWNGELAKPLWGDGQPRKLEKIARQETRRSKKTESPTTQPSP